MDCYYVLYLVLALATSLAALKFLLWRWTLPGIQQRSVLVTGCDSGFGRLLALDLYDKGVTVYAGCLLKKSTDEFRNSYGSRLKPMLLDVSDSNSVQAAAQFVASDLGEKALWAIVNNAGIGGTVSPFEWTTKDNFRTALEVNLLGTHDVILKFLPLLRRGKQGRIVNMASANGRLTFAASPYSASKYALESLSEGLSYELEPFNISVHILEPSVFKTQIINRQTFMKNFSSTLAHTREDVKELYGGEEYLRSFLEYNYKAMSSMASEDVYLAVAAYEHALFARFPQTRYQVGFSAKWFWIPFSLLPLGIQKALYKCFLKCSGDRPPSPKGAFKR